ncbi:hypothetical protein SBOR_8257 [Sclerotinia borealis F-4128]|uniref:ER-bound oxygenase mpaB/mpaB'/Rubber oxygenase catalytic domain-containing protein n=1 Tax=Sclerotinia borealis (strain F-4128) TaxID=1432307 RepID=W9C921_SCLBF|nr:hypothetical protein SBOR_8257 [Sclerotinia borealis F-4128]
MSINTTIHFSLPRIAASSFLPSPPSTTVILFIISTYLLAIHYLRFSRRDSMVKKFGYNTRESFKYMTNTDAQKITSYIGELEFPRFYKTSLQFALFKTYGIPTISKLLVDTKQFSSKETASKRYADTGILIGEIASHHPLHPRVLKAISRMNYLHSPYQKAGKISNDDLLYTLSVFITEPIAWIGKYEWRVLNEMEICAISTFWKGIGDGMGISYEVLKRGHGGKVEWKDGIEFYEDIKEWAEEYERKFMVPNPYNKRTADALVPLLLFLVPKALLPFAHDAVGVLMGPLLRSAMIYPEPSPLNTTITNNVLNTRKYLLAHFSLPRPQWMRVREISSSDDEGIDGRFHSTNYLVHPYYQKPGWWNSWGPMAMVTRVLGGFVPEEVGDEKGMGKGEGRNNEWRPQGYRFEEIGPEKKEGVGEEDMRRWEERLGRERTGGCPFAFANGK